MVYLPHKDYFEGILQLRGQYEDVLDWVVAQTKKDQKAVITKEKKVRGGIDLYFSSQRYLTSLAKKLNQQFSGIMKTSSTLHTHKKGDALYRVTVLFHALPIKPGDIITIKGEQVELLKIGNKAHVKNVKTGKKQFVDLDTLIRHVS